MTEIARLRDSVFKLWD